ncbi:dyp-type peroxidase family protein [Mycobacteroides abscessus subsp. bolletii 1513]|uniref:Dyp-type peroxidase family protein n=1 Tax=Mycobacteroides abscessus subsp. bolletii 1513 TaxID=1299321 RepID=X8DNE4_9MYCO|nr:dyp-type peroxidase family protein [Mycobacteroides abscessus subsp. bolletii 1513]
MSTGLNRRKLLGAAGVTAAVAGAAGAGVLGGRASAASTGPVNVKVPFRGDHQAGIVTPAQDRMHFCAFDVMPNATRGEVQAMLRQWTEMADRMTRGEETTSGGALDGNPYSPPTDTGEALDLTASALTLTIGFGPSFFRKDGVDQFGIADKLPHHCRNCPSSATRSWIRPAAAVISASRPAPTIRRSRCTPSAIWLGWASAPSRSSGRSWDSGAPHRPVDRR